MSNNANIKVKSCIFCKKTLIDEKFPFCLRCRLKIKKVGKVGGATIAGCWLTAYAINQNMRNNTTDALGTDVYNSDDDATDA